MKTLAIIEDTGERRSPLSGETWAIADRSGPFDVAGGIYRHDPSTPNIECVILRVTVFDGDAEPELSLKERIELIHLRKFAKQVKDASVSLSAHDIDGPEELLKEAKQLATRMQFAGIVLGESMKEFEGREGDDTGFLGRKGLVLDYYVPKNDWPTASDLANDAMTVQGVTRAAQHLPESVDTIEPPPFVPDPPPIPAAPAVVASPFTTEEEA